MNKVLTDNINEVAKEDDEVWCLGDWCYRGQDAEHYRKHLRCRNINLILGNHDDHNISKYKGFRSVQHYKELRIDKKLIVMSHYPMRSWRNSSHGSIMLHGHCHGNLPDIGGRIADMGVDCWDFKPVNLEYIVELLEKRPIYAPDISPTREYNNEEARV